MSILIKGMKMPTEEEIGKCIIVRHDGEVRIVEFDNLVDGGFVACFPTNPMRAVPVPPHGDLIDAEEEMRLMQSCDYDTYDDYNRAFDMLDNAPIIIPAEEGE